MGFFKKTKKDENERVLKLVQGVELVFVRVSEGEFPMGSTDGEIEELVQAAAPDDRRMRALWEQEEPRHSVALPEFWIGKTPVTKAQFGAFVAATGHQTTAEREGGERTWKHPRGLKDSEGNIIVDFSSDDLPVRCVSWGDVAAFCAWSSKVSGVQVRLPSEAEWEKAARGTDGRLYPWGNDWSNLNACTYERHERPNLPFETTAPGPSPAGSYRSGASPYGALDMAGNVREMTRSLGAPYPYDAADGRENMPSGEVEVRISRGGSWWEHKVHARCADRGRFMLDETSDELGFRCALGPSS